MLVRGFFMEIETFLISKMYKYSHFALC